MNNYYEKPFHPFFLPQLDTDETNPNHETNETSPCRALTLGAGSPQSIGSMPTTIPSTPSPHHIRTFSWAIPPDTHDKLSQSSQADSSSDSDSPMISDEESAEIPSRLTRSDFENENLEITRPSILNFDIDYPGSIDIKANTILAACLTGFEKIRVHPNATLIVRGRNVVLETEAVELLGDRNYGGMLTWDTGGVISGPLTEHMEFAGEYFPRPIVRVRRYSNLTVSRPSLPLFQIASSVENDPVSEPNNKRSRHKP